MLTNAEMKRIANVRGRLNDALALFVGHHATAAGRNGQDTERARREAQEWAEALLEALDNLGPDPTR
jgi:hypothetical protein